MIHTKAKRRNGRGTTHTYVYDSISEMGEHCAEINKRSRKLDTQDSSIKRKQSADWCLNTSLEEAIKMTCAGGNWLQGAKDLQKVSLTGELEKLGLIPDLALEHGEIGSRVDIGEYLANSPECYMQALETEVPAPVVKLAVVVNVSWKVTAQAKISRGRAVLALIDALEARGYSVQLDATMCFLMSRGETGSDCVYTSTIKKAGEPWNPSSVAFALCHPAFNRRVGFRLAESSDGSQVTNESYGNGLNYVDASADVTLGYIHSDHGYESDEGALRTVINELKTQAPSLTFSTLVV